MSFNVGPRVVSATGGSIKRVGNYRIHTFPSELVTDGLVLNLDAGDPRSYPGSGTTWTDLSGYAQNGTLTNGPTYSNANGGSLSFDGTNDHILGTLPLITGEVTIEAWVKFDGVTNPQTVFAQGQDAVSFSCGLVVNNSQIRFRNTNGDFVPSSPSTLVTGQWCHLVFSTTGLLTTGYVNGISNGTTPNVISSNNVQTYKIGQRPTISEENLDGNISIVRLYNRALSAAEVAQNYDALKVRYTGYTNTFTPTCGGGSGKVEVLCVAGGGGGGASIAGGGGAGGLLYNSAFTVNASAGIGLTVGAGGTGGTDQNIGNGIVANNTNGGNSSFSSLTSIGGGKGGPEYRGDGFSGGSGGGASRSTNAGGPIYVGGASTVGQGNSGGTGSNSGGQDGYGSGAGGGGAGSVGGNAIGSTAGNGGNGLVISISGASVTYAGGGGGGAYNGTGGTGGSGGGGNGGSGASNSVPQNAIPNTGSGGGGGGYPNNKNAGNGSNGIIIVRYPATDYNVELLVVGGGGGGGGNTGDAWNGGGGGAGGLIYYSSYPVSAGTKYSVTVGVGGTAGISTSSNNGSTTTQGANGGNSILGPLVAIGGGGGGASSGNGTGTGTKNNGLNGGSGGGGAISYNAASKTSGGVGVSGQGNSGGQGDNTGTGYSGGGGGAGGPGTGPGVHNVTNFGPGLVFSITGSSVSYAQGGQGGRDPVTNAAANSGTGGDGARSAVNTLGQSGAGGSGIIIIAYQGPQRGIGGTVDTTSRPGYTLHKFTTTGTDFFIP